MIKINNTEYDATAVVSGNNTMAITFLNGTVKTIADAEALFGSSLKIEVFENNELTGTYYNKSIASVTAKSNGADSYRITILLGVTRIQESVEDTLKKELKAVNEVLSSVKENASVTSDDVEILSGAIEDLATLMAEILTNVETIKEEVAALNTTSDVVESDTETVVDDAETESEATNG